jgi:hypothetical protein
MAGIHPTLPERLPLIRQERRFAGRFLPLPVVLCQVNVGAGGASLRASLTDISRGGVGLRTRQVIAPETLLTVSLTNSPGLFSCTRTAVVRFVRTRAQGDYQLGCQFETPLDREAMQFLHA